MQGIYFDLKEKINFTNWIDFSLGLGYWWSREISSGFSHLLQKCFRCHPSLRCEQQKVLCQFTAMVGRGQ